MGIPTQIDLKRYWELYEIWKNLSEREKERQKEREGERERERERGGGEEERRGKETSLHLVGLSSQTPAQLIKSRAAVAKLHCLKCLLAEGTHVCSLPERTGRREECMAFGSGR